MNLAILLHYNIIHLLRNTSTPYSFTLSERSEAGVCGRSRAVIEDSNPAGDMNVFLCECCVLSG